MRACGSAKCTLSNESVGYHTITRLRVEASPVNRRRTSLVDHTVDSRPLRLSAQIDYTYATQPYPTKKSCAIPATCSSQTLGWRVSAS